MSVSAASEHLSRLEAILRDDGRAMAVLRTVREQGPPAAYVGAGLIRASVWNALTGAAGMPGPTDVDVVYIDRGDLDRGDESRYEDRLSRACPEVDWDVKNQAAVHLWYADKFGVEVEPLESLEDAVATWPETCTCVAVRLDRAGRLRVIAPFGLEDLFGMVWRHNPAVVSREQFRQRVASKHPEERWPGVTVVE